MRNARQPAPRFHPRGVDPTHLATIRIAKASRNVDTLIQLLHQNASKEITGAITLRQDLPAEVRAYIIERSHEHTLANVLTWKNLTFDEATTIAMQTWFEPTASQYAMHSKVQKVYYEAIANLVMVARGQGDSTVLDRVGIPFKTDRWVPSRLWDDDYHVLRHAESLVENSMMPMELLTLPFMKVATTSADGELIQKSGARWAAYMLRAGTPLTEEILAEALRSSTVRLRMAIAGRSDAPEGLLLAWLQESTEEERLPVKVKNKIVSNRLLSAAVCDAVVDSVIREDVHSRSVSYLVSLLVVHPHVPFEKMVTLLSYNFDAVRYQCEKNPGRFEQWLKQHHPALVGFPEEWIWSALSAQ